MAPWSAYVTGEVTSLVVSQVTFVEPFVEARVTGVPTTGVVTRVASWWRLLANGGNPDATVGRERRPRLARRLLLLGGGLEPRTPTGAAGHDH